MGDNELLIKVNADAKSAEQAFDDIREKTESFENQLESLAKISAVGFAALTAEIALSVHAFGEADAASRELTQTLQTQGIISAQVAIQAADGTEKVLNIAEAYKQYANEVSRLTGVDSNQITAAQSIAQSYLGQTQVTKELTQAIVDLSVQQKIGLNEAATLVGRTIGTTTNAFSRQGLQIADTADKTERFGKVLQFVNGLSSGQAAAANQSIGSIKGLETAFSNAQETIGARFAPAVTLLIGKFTELFQFFADSPLLGDLAAAFLVAGTAVTALGIAIPVVITGFLALTAAASAFGTTVSVAFAGIPIIIGLIVAAITFLALNWDASLKRISAVTTGFIDFVSGAFGGLAKIIAGALTLDQGKIEEGLAELKAAYTKGTSEAFASLPKEAAKAVDEQNAVLAAGAEKRAAQEAAAAAIRAQLRQNENDLIREQLEYATQQAIEIKQQEIAVLKQLNEQQTQDTKVLLQERYEQLKAQEDEQRQEDIDRDASFAELRLQSAQSLAITSQQFNDDLRDQEIQKIEGGLLTEQEVEKKIYADKLKETVKQNNTFLEEQKKYGVAYATINEAIHSNEVQGVAQATGELVALTNSKNATLKAIGKAASIAQITIKTAESAINVFNGFSAIPIVGPELGFAAAAAVVAYGAEQIGNVIGAADGALVTGGIPGKDSVPFLLSPGELVVPQKNFNDVVTGFNAVQGGGSGLGSDEQTVSLLASIDAKLSQPSQYIFQGDVLADNSFIDVLISKINDRLRFGNARLAIDGA